MIGDEVKLVLFSIQETSTNSVFPAHFLNLVGLEIYIVSFVHSISILGKLQKSTSQL